MRLTQLAALSFLVSVGAVIIPLERAIAQPAPSPAEPAAPTQPAPPTEPSPPPPPQAAPPPPTNQAGPPPASQAAPSPAVAVTHSNVNLRNGPGTTFAVVTLIPAGSSVDVNDCKDEWCHVAFHGHDGYIIESSIAPGAPRPVVRRSPPRYVGPPPGYGGPPPGYSGPAPGYGPPPGYYDPPPAYYGYGYYYGPYWGWRHRYWHRW
ncbi:MAG TPA: SH3 domain-containing protein [Xanthobacteraceae bacterium]|nr:SH3 domain-containing protein [Xanthobacteraceae bacterium]